MSIEFGLTKDRFNTQYAPLGLLLALYKENQILQALEKVAISAKTMDFSPQDKVEQVFVSILGGCETLSEVNTKLKGDLPLAQAGGWRRFADQSPLSLTLDALTLTNIEQLRKATGQIWRDYRGTAAHDWRGFLWLDYDLSGLPCGKQAESGKKGYFSGKKTSRDGNWLVSVPLITKKLSGRTFSPATNSRSIAYLMPSKGCKVH